LLSALFKSGNWEGELRKLVPRTVESENLIESAFRRNDTTAVIGHRQR